MKKSFLGGVLFTATLIGMEQEKKNQLVQLPQVLTHECKPHAFNLSQVVKEINSKEAERVNEKDVIKRKLIAINFHILEEERNKGNKVAGDAINFLIQSSKQTTIEINDQEVRKKLECYGFLKGNQIEENAVKFIRDILEST